MKLYLCCLAWALLLLSAGRWSRANDAKITVEAVSHPGPVDFEKEVLPILNRSCLACHNRTKSKAHLILETPADIRKGGSGGPAAVPGHGAESLLLLAASHAKDDLVMPPADNKVAAPDLTPQQLGLIRLWIDQGAEGEVHELSTIHWQALPSGLDPVYAVAITADGQFAACGRGNQVFVYHIPTRRLLTALSDPALSRDPAYSGAPVAHRDVVNAAAFSPDGRLLATGGYREIKLWRRASNARRFTLADASSSKILCLSASPDGARFATGDARGHIRLFDASGHPIAQCAGHTAAVNSLCFSSDGATLASASADGAVRVWASATGRPMAVAYGDAPVNAVAWTESGRLVSGGDDKLLHVWRFEADSETPLVPLRTISGHDGPVTCVAWTPSNANDILSGSTDGTARLWSLGDGKELRRFSHGGPVTAVAIRPDGKRFATAGSNHIARLWDVGDGKQIAEIRGDHDARQNVLARQRELASLTSLASYQASALKAAETQHASELAHLKQAGEAALAADKAVVEKQKLLDEASKAKAAAEKTVAGLNAELKRATEARDSADKASKEAVAAAKSALSAKRQVEVSSIEDIARKAYAAGQASAAFEAMSNRVREPLKEASDKAAAEAKRVTESQAAVAAAQAAQAKAQGELEVSVRLVQQAADAETAAKETARLAEARRAKTEAELAAAKERSAASEHRILAIAFSSDSTSLALAGDDQAVRTYSAEDGVAFDARRGHQGAVEAVAFARSGAILSAGADRTVIAWDPDDSWSLERVLGTGDSSSPIADRVNALAFSPDGRRLASGGGVPSRGGEIKLWQVDSGKLLASFDDLHADSVLALAFSPDGGLLASGAADRFMKVIDTGSGKLVRAFEGHTNHVLGVCWKADGRTLATAGADNVIKTWDLFSGQRIKTIEGFGKEVTSVNYLGDGNRLLATCGDGTARIVTDEGAAVRGLFAGPDFLNCSAVTPDGEFVLTGGDDGLVRVWVGPEFKQQALPRPDSPVAGNAAARR